jgi:hypothetical protein
MQAGNAPHLPDTASSTKATKKKAEKAKKKAGIWPAFILFFFIGFGFITIGYYDGWKFGLMLFLGDAFITPLLAFLLQKSSLKFRYYLQGTLITLAVLAPTTYALYIIGGILTVIGGYAACLILLIFGIKQTN